MLNPDTLVAARYRVVAPLGRGGMGVVYRAVHLGLGREVALKVLEPDETDEGHGHRETRFEREAKTAARLDHPGIVRVLDYGRAGANRYLAMELLDGPTLSATLSRCGRMGAATAVAAAREILAALAHAHAAGVVHRDVKPENVMFGTRDGRRRLILIDFGLARLRDDAALTARGTCVGSVSYVAPERLAGDTVDGRADLYSVGVMLYEMLAGVRPFTGTPTEVAEAHLILQPRPLRAIRPDVPAALAAVVVRAMSKSPDRRFSNASAMLAALQAALAPSRPIKAVRAASSSSRLDRPIEALPTDALPMLIPSLPRRAWSWFRFGAWRWRRASPA
jgi:serine/threonine-protein kinase